MCRRINQGPPFDPCDRKGERSRKTGGGKGVVFLTYEGEGLQICKYWQTSY